MLIYDVYKKRKELKLKIKKLISEEARGEKLYLEDSSEIRYLPFPAITGIEMLGNLTMIQLVSVEPFVIILIKNKDITNDLKKQFEFLWKTSRK